MPSSWASQISPIMTIILAMSPRSILDIGAGFGKYGVLCREYLDVVRSARSSPTYPPPRRVTIDCIEAWSHYVSPIHTYVYDNVYVGGATGVLSTLSAGAYDLALVVDVLEHFGVEEGRQLMEATLRVAGAALVATPTTDMPQGATFGNEYERHRSHWTPGQLRKLAAGSRFFRSLSAHTGHICLLSSDVALVSRVSRQVRAFAWIACRTSLLERCHLRQPLRRLFRRDALPSGSPWREPGGERRGG
jgi:hypothetical protein